MGCCLAVGPRVPQAPGVSQQPLTHSEFQSRIAFVNKSLKWLTHWEVQSMGDIMGNVRPARLSFNDLGSSA